MPLEELFPDIFKFRFGSLLSIVGGVIIFKTLTLSLKSKWFNMIKSGQKKEEYRELKPYWRKRLKAQRFDILVFTLGYPKKNDIERRLEFKNPKIRIDTGRIEWGAEPGRLYFVISWDVI